MNTHDKALETIINNTKTFFDYEEYFISKESRFVKDNNIIREPDITIFLPNKTILVVEYKTHNHKSKAIKQLNHEELLFKQYFNNYNIKKYYVHDEYVIEKVM